MKGVGKPISVKDWQIDYLALTSLSKTSAMLCSSRLTALKCQFMSWTDGDLNSMSKPTAELYNASDPPQDIGRDPDGITLNRVSSSKALLCYPSMIRGGPKRCGEGKYHHCESKLKCNWVTQSDSETKLEWAMDLSRENLDDFEDGGFATSNRTVYQQSTLVLGNSRAISCFMTKYKPHQNLLMETFEVDGGTNTMQPVAWVKVDGNLNTTDEGLKVEATNRGYQCVPGSLGKDKAYVVFYAYRVMWVVPLW